MRSMKGTLFNQQIERGEEVGQEERGDTTGGV